MNKNLRCKIRESLSAESIETNLEVLVPGKTYHLRTERNPDGMLISITGIKLNTVDGNVIIDYDWTPMSTVDGTRITTQLSHSHCTAQQMISHVEESERVSSTLD